MSEWYESEDELASGPSEGEFRFPRSFRPPPSRRAPAPRPFQPSRPREASAPRFRPPSPWRAPVKRRSTPGRRWLWLRRRRPWLIYGGGPYYAPTDHLPAEEPAPAMAPEPEPSVEPPEDVQAAPPEEAAPGEGSAQEYEYRARRGPVSARITNWERKQLTRYPLAKTDIPAGGGLYLVERDGLPLYVGEAQSFKVRWQGRLLGMYQAGLINSGNLPAPITLWFGLLHPNTERDRKTVEHAIIRTLELARIVPRRHLRNVKSINPFTVTAGVKIENLLPPLWAGRASQSGALASYLQNNTLTLPAAVTYEFLGGGGW